ncbi:glycosyltransferase family 4 protein [Thalassotalea montiporae]
MSVKVIFGVDSLLNQMSGVGYYSREILKKVSASNDMERMLFFAHGRFFELKDFKTSHSNNSASENKKNKVREYLSRSKLATSLYMGVIPIKERLSLSNYKDFIFHSPNFHLPQFGGKKVVTVHDLSTLLFPEFHPSNRLKFINKQLKNIEKSADAIVTVSPMVRDEILKHFPNTKNRVFVTPLGVSEQFLPKEKSSVAMFLSKDNLLYHKYFLFVSTIEPRKNLDRLLDAFKIYFDKRVQFFPLVIIGGVGWKSDRVMTKIRELERLGVVLYKGYVQEEHMPYYYSGARALLMPSIYEGFGLPVLEAMSCNTAVVTSDNTPMADIVGDCGVMVNPFSIEDMARKIIELSEDQGMYLELAKLGRHKSKSYSWAECAEKTMDIYKALS